MSVTFSFDTPLIMNLGNVIFMLQLMVSESVPLFLKYLNQVLRHVQNSKNESRKPVQPISNIAAVRVLCMLNPKGVFFSRLIRKIGIIFIFSSHFSAFSYIIRKKKSKNVL